MEPRLCGKLGCIVFNFFGIRPEWDVATCRISGGREHFGFIL